MFATPQGMFGKTDAPEMLAKTCGWSEDSAYWTPTPMYDIRAVNNRYVHKRDLMDGV